MATAVAPRVCARRRIVRAFLIEEQKIVKEVLKKQAAARKRPKAEKPKKATKGKQDQKKQKATKKK